jgi:hypothetical protein
MAADRVACLPPFGSRIVGSPETIAVRLWLVWLTHVNRCPLHLCSVVFSSFQEGAMRMLGSLKGLLLQAKGLKGSIPLAWLIADSLSFARPDTGVRAHLTTISVFPPVTDQLPALVKDHILPEFQNPLGFMRARVSFRVVCCPSTHPLSRLAVASTAVCRVLSLCFIVVGGPCLSSVGWEDIERWWSQKTN